MQSIHYVKNVNDFKEILNTKNHIVTIGVFDGVHKGHQSLISQTIKKGVEQNLKSSLITFQNSPYHHIKKLNDNNSYLNTIEEKTSILKRLQLDQIKLIEFNDSINQTSATEFLKILNTNINMQRLIVGPDFAFGKDRIGDIKFLTQNQNLFGYELSVVDTYKKDSEIVSSTKIKKLIVSGEIEQANSYIKTYEAVNIRIDPIIHQKDYANEIIYGLVMTTGGRIHPRVGGLEADQISANDGLR